eukprot:SAG31_NODE_381_length_16458_cov_18.069259_13_plen_356_part_00
MFNLSCFEQVHQASSEQVQAQVQVVLDGNVVGKGWTDGINGSFDVSIPAQQPTSIGNGSAVPREHTIEVHVRGDPSPARLLHVVFGDLIMCTGQNVALSMAATRASMVAPCPLCNASAAIVSASNQFIRLMVVAPPKNWSLSGSQPQNHTHLSTRWSAVNPQTVENFSALCYYFGKEIFDSLGANMSIGLVQSAVADTYIQSLMPQATLAVCNNSGTMPSDWIPARKPGTNVSSATYNPWAGGQNRPSYLWNAMLNPLRTLQFKMAIFDNAEQNMATGDSSATYQCLQQQMIHAWRSHFDSNFSVHVVQVIYFDSKSVESSAQNQCSHIISLTLNIISLISAAAEFQHDRGVDLS